MPGCLRAGSWRQEIKSDICLMISQLRVLSGKNTRGLVQAQARDSHIDPFIYSLPLPFDSQLSKANLLKQVLSGREAVLTEILMSALLPFSPVNIKILSVSRCCIFFFLIQNEI